MAENPKLEMDFDELTVFDQMDRLQYSVENSDSFLIDMESISVGSNGDVTASPSRVTLQRNLSRKGSMMVGGNEKKTNSNVMATKGGEGDAAATSSPKAATFGHCMPEKPTGISVGASDHSSNPQGHHQITITASNMNANADSRLNLRKNSFRRHSQSCFFDPKRILILFATLSSIGTLLLIYFTLTISQPDADDNVLNWQQ